MFRAVLKTLTRRAIRDKKKFSLSCLTEWCATIGSAALLLRHLVRFIHVGRCCTKIKFVQYDGTPAEIREEFSLIGRPSEPDSAKCN